MLNDGDTKNPMIDQLWIDCATFNFPLQNPCGKLDTAQML
jgi:hypothetical protein